MAKKKTTVKPTAARKRAAAVKAKGKGRAIAEGERTPSGRLKVPIGIREGGAAFAQIHDDLARTALHLLAERGYADMRMDDVAVAAGMSKRTVYRHFPTKVDLATAAIRQLTTFQGWIDGDDDLPSRIRRAMDIGAAHHHYFAPVLATVIVHRLTVPELLVELRAHVLEPREEVVRALIEYGQHTGQIRQEIDPALVAAMLTGQAIDHLTGMHPMPEGAALGEWAITRAWPMLAV